MILNRRSVGNRQPRTTRRGTTPTFDPPPASTGKPRPRGPRTHPASVTGIRHTLPVTALTMSGGPLAEALRKAGRRVQSHRGQALVTEGDLADRVLVIERG